MRFTRCRRWFCRAALAIFALPLLLSVQARAITISTVAVGNVGNANDPADGDSGTAGIQNFGAVGYAYSVGTTEVTVGQYTAFLNAVAATDTYLLYNTSMTTNLAIAGISRSGVSGSYSYSVIGSANHPVTYVSWGDAARFSNWLHNGQPTGAQNASTTEAGAYPLNGAITAAALNAISRNGGATWFIPTENEWYKAAYHQPAAQGGDADNYWAYPSGTNSTPYSDQPPGSGAPTQSNTGNFYANDSVANGYNDGYAVTGSTVFSGTQNYLTDAGAYTSASSPYGTFDQGGNVYEWNEALPSGSSRGLRGGSWDSLPGNQLSSQRSFSNPTFEGVAIGFRVATVPEPSTFILAIVGLAAVLLVRARKRGAATCVVASAMLGLCVGVSTSARAVTIPTVPVGNAGNGNDPLTGNLYGGVSYDYRIGTTEVTVRQYTAFLNAVAATDTYALYSTLMATDPNIAGISRSGVSGSYTYSVIGSADHPVTFVSWGDAARFSNWMHNGQPTGAQNASTTEGGAYPLNGAVTQAALNAISRNAGAHWFIPSENEWYKAAYHQPAAQGGDADNYWAYPTKTNSTPYSDRPPGIGAPTPSNSGNFYKDDGIANSYDNGYAVTGSTGYSGSQNYLTDAGAYTSATSPYHTFDQGGNVFEWNEALITGLFRGERGGSWDGDSSYLQSTDRLFTDPTYENYYLGFRVATLAVPEPPSLVLAACGCGVLFAVSRRRRIGRLRAMHTFYR